MALTDNPMSLVVTGNVTVGATKLSTDSETGTESGSVTISYSQSINNQTPKVTDY